MASLILATAVVKEVISKLASLGWQELELLWDFKDDLEDMDRNLSTLQAVLQDAEKLSVQSASIRLWLDELKDAAYDIEDMMNDFLVQSQHWSKDDFYKKVRQFFSSSNSLTSSVENAHKLKKMRKTSSVKNAHKLKKMRKRLDKIAERRNKFHLKEDDSSDKQQIIKERESFSAIGKLVVHGRDQEKERIIELLLDKNSNEDVSVLPIVGIGGLGKTTLAKFIYNDDRIQDEQNFQLRAWVYVSMEFDLTKLVGAVLSATNWEGALPDHNLQRAVTCLSGRLSGKRYLIVLDDAWKEDMVAWRNLMDVLSGGARGSKIIVTTRSQKVAQMVGTIQPHQLKPLSEDDCWRLFKENAFVSADEGDKHQNLVKIGKEIAKKCGGVAFAAVTLGNVMRSKRNESWWTDLRDSEIWELHKNEMLSEDKIMSTLKLSYMSMPPPLKLSFSYCSIFPKGYKIDKAKLIQQWIALGFVKTTRQNMSRLLDIGEKYIDDLRSMSFLQDFEEHKKTRRVTCKMHDLVHDLAQFVGGGDAMITNDSKEAYEDVKSYLYIALVGYEEPRKIYAAVSRKARALHFRMCGLTECPKQLFSCIGNVRVLDLSGCFIDELPASINKLEQLRYLDASNLPLHKLPEFTGEHLNLQILNLSNSSLATIPETIGRLCQLLFLNLSGCSSLRTLPVSLGNLQNLQHLDLSGCSELESLPESIGNLQCLQYLDLPGCSGLISLPESISKLQYLQRPIDLSGCSGLISLPESISMLQCLEKHLDLSGCSGLISLPKSITNFQGLEYLNLSECSGLTSVPESISNLHCLEYFDLSKCSGLTSLPNSISNLRSLQYLDLSYCKGLTSLPNSISNLHSLQHLDLSYCQGLTLLPKSITKLQCLQQHLNLSGCGGLESLPKSIGNLQNLQYLNLSSCGGLLSLPESINKLQYLQHLNLSWCRGLVPLPESISNLHCLQRLNLSNCRELILVPESISNIQYLQYLNLAKCIKLVSLPESISNLQYLQHLNLYNCSALISLPKSFSNLQCLQYLDLSYCVKLRELPEDIGKLVNLQHLNLSSCRALQKLPQSLCDLVNLEKLDLTECHQVRDYLPREGLVKISSLVVLDSDGKEISMGTDPLKLQLYAISNECEKKISMAELQYLSPSSDRLVIGGLENLKDPADAANARLGEKGTLHSLTLKWGEIRCNWGWRWDEVLERLLPPSNLRVLKLHGYLGDRFPSWMMDGMHLQLPNLVEMELVGIEGCNQLPQLCQLPHLQKLELSRMNLIRNMGGEFYGGNHIEVAFPSLEELRLYDMRNLEWATIMSGDCETRQVVVMFPYLKYLEIARCPNLRPRPCIPPSVVRLDLDESDEALSWDYMGPSYSCSSSSPSSIVETQEQEFHSRLEELDIRSCQKLTRLPEGMRHLQSLRSLRIQYCDNLTALPEWLGELTSLTRLLITGCKKLDRSLPQSLQHFSASGKVSVEFR